MLTPLDTLTAFLIFAVLLALELLARQNWLPAYYRFGIPVYHARGEMNNRAAPEGLEHALAERFKERPGIPRLRFKQLSGGPERAAIAFHEALFEPRGGPRFFPMMHSLVEVDTARREARVTGWLNGYVIFLLGYLVYATLMDRGFLFVAVLVVFLFGLSYIAQAAVNHAVIEEIRAGRNGSAGA